MTNGGWTASPAGVADIDELVRLAGVMFDDVGLDGTDPDWTAAAHRMLHERLGWDVRGVVARPAERQSGPLVAQVLGVTVSRLPDPYNLAGTSGYVLWAVTDHSWRRRGIARELLTQLADNFRRDGVQDLELHASPGGLRLYEEFGFEVGPYPGLRLALK